MHMSPDIAVDEAALAEADETLRALAEAYPDYAAVELEELAATLDRIKSGSEAVTPDALFIPAHNLKGQGAAFGYELITTLGEALCSLVRGRSALPPPDQSLVARLIAACRFVLSHRLTGDGGPAGTALLRDLRLRSS